MSKASDLDKVVKAYIIDNIDSSGYEASPETDEEKVRFLSDTFHSEYGFRIPQIGKQRALKEWFSGLPSSCSIAFYNHDILKLAEKWGYLSPDATESKQEKIINNWFNQLAAKTDQLFNKHAKG